MLKSKTITALLIGLMGGFIMAKPVRAANIVSIQALPEYISANDFMISCTTSASSVTFSYSKHGGTTYDFATIDLSTGPCQAHVTSLQVSEQTDYKFTVSDGVVSSSTTTIYDTVGPAPVTGYSKERVNNGQYRIRWTTPGDNDFARVIIYRGDATGFNAEITHEIAKIAGDKNRDMSYDDYFAPDPGKTYYYLIRAVDKAGNSSGLVGDGGETITITPTPVAVTRTGTIILPKESAPGSVLGSEATPSPAPVASISPNVVSSINNFAAKTPEPFRWILTHKKISIGIALLAAGIVYIALSLIKKRK